MQVVWLELIDVCSQPCILCVFAAITDNRLLLWNKGFSESLIQEYKTQHHHHTVVYLHYNKMCANGHHKHDHTMLIHCQISCIALLVLPNKGENSLSNLLHSTTTVIAN